MDPHPSKKKHLPGQPHSSFAGDGRKCPKDGYKVASLLLHRVDIFTYINEFLAFEKSLVYLVLCKKLRLNWFRYTSVLSVPGKRSFGDNELAYFLLNMESLREIDITQCQQVERFPRPVKNNIHPNLISVKLASTCVSLPSLQSYFGQSVGLSSFQNLSSSTSGAHHP